MTRQIPVTQARAELSDLVSRVAFSGERVSLTRHGKSVAALVSAADLSRLEALDEATSGETAPRGPADRGDVDREQVPGHAAGTGETGTSGTETTDDDVADHPERVGLSPVRLDPVGPIRRGFGIAAEHRPAEHRPAERHSAEQRGTEHRVAAEHRHPPAG
ncbi:type II toxin-antitoxin system Phd/YefM family antitoxin [Parafrankia sp. BMG5.11]|uniref:type II toxin-antitoxin system Phd/YefM family antitoxin n=1 Tax=Parafrankia sp. BMG5.11 TaxID=222540 RepID=UPI00104082DA|nr:type II toxin-antitoxin system Phd/YefM family antitoxin [Parafrankia sp. BMG5.11]TCJ35364.1 type II toxin-antitoxin system Phd/YefM family antitoxin [Parafrankia sp. BMG5.11]